MESVPAEFVEKLIAYGDALSSLSLNALSVAAGTVLILVYWRA